jgi:hypothetical protein
MEQIGVAIACVIAGVFAVAMCGLALAFVYMALSILSAVL